MKGRPAETGGAFGSIALLLALVLGVDDDTVIAAIGVAVGLVPAVITLLVANGGIRGVIRVLWRGRAQQDAAVVEAKPRRR